MSLSLTNLDEKTRAKMLEELEQDVNAGKLYMSPRLNDRGVNDYPELLKSVISDGDDGYLAKEIRTRGLLKAEETRKKPSGGFSVARVPITAPDTLAEGEFNRFYIRGLCSRATEEGIPELVVYRAKVVTSPRSESEMKIGTRVNAERLLEDLRTHTGVDTALGLPPGPNSGLSVRLP